MLMSFLCLQASAGGWTQPAGGHYAKFGGRAIPGQGFFLDAGDEASLAPRPYVDIAIEGYVEYGLTDAWTLVGQATPIGYARVDDGGTPYTGVVQAGVRRALSRGRHNLALQVDVGYTPPLGERDLFEASPPRGDGGRVYRYVPAQSGAQADLLLGYGLGLDRVWVSADLGVAGFSNPDIQPAVLSRAEIGWETAKRNRWVFAVPTRTHVGPGPDTNLAGSGQTDYVGFMIGYTLVFGASDWGVTTGLLGVATATANEAAPTIPIHVEHQHAP